MLLIINLLFKGLYALISVLIEIIVKNIMVDYGEFNEITIFLR
jgi:hypothetical protein